MVDDDWRAPQIDRVPEPLLFAERAGLEAWLDYHRDTLLTKCQGLSAEQLRRRAVEPSSLSLLGLVRHMSEVERGWFCNDLESQGLPDLYCGPDNRDGDFDDVDEADPVEAFETYAAELARVREVAARHELDDAFTSPRGNRLDLRWIYLHMIEEYARHNGHADLLRERIDGVTGD
jgi:uncharacterized damage-inducible protein DinB